MGEAGVKYRYDEVKGKGVFRAKLVIPIFQSALS